MSMLNESTVSGSEPPLLTVICGYDNGVSVTAANTGSVAPNTAVRPIQPTAHVNAPPAAPETFSEVARQSMYWSTSVVELIALYKVKYGAAADEVAVWVKFVAPESAFAPITAYANSPKSVGRT